jgi:hypothetical protein
MSGLCFALAEQGKVLALAGDHGEALRPYRESIRLAVEARLPEVVFRHTTQCVLESLEALGSWDEILAFCDRAEAHYVAEPPEHDLARQDRASHFERKGVVLLKAGRSEDAREALEAAKTHAAAPLPLAAAVLRWLQSGLHVDARRVEAEQRRLQYFTVRKDTVDPTRAVALPNGLGQPTIGRP